MSELFDICVDILYWISGLTGLTYKEANIWVFVIIHPLISLIMFARINYLNKRILKPNYEKSR